MRMGMVGLGRMGANMTRRLRRGGIEVVGYNRELDIVDQLAEQEGMIAARSLAELVGKLTPPRVVWLMVPAGEATEQNVQELSSLLAEEDVVVDGGNANYQDTLRRSQELSARGIRLVDAGTSGGIWGLNEGYCLMVGGDAAAVAQVEPALRVLAPADDRGWGRVGPPGSGHFTKMVHNGIEYGMMQAMAEGFALMQAKPEFDIDLAQMSELWRHGSVIRSWLLDLTASGLAEDAALSEVAPFVADSGEGRWAAKESVDLGVATPVMTLALQMRFASQDQEGFSNRMLAMMRNAFGGHAIKKSD